MYFLSQNVFSALVFVVLLNFFHLNFIHSLGTTENNATGTNNATGNASATFTKCEDCVNSDCFKTQNGTCVVGADNATFTCALCSAPDASGNEQFLTEDLCKSSCTDATKCKCIGSCYVCEKTAGTGTSTTSSNSTCPTVAFKVDANCQQTSLSNGTTTN